MTYSLIFVCAYHEFLNPLVTAQLFQQAYLQQVMPGSLKPNKTYVWIRLPLQFVINKKFKNHKKHLEHRFSGLTIRFIPGISRISFFPSQLIAIVNRLRLKGRVIFHCRGYEENDLADAVKAFFRNDKVISDIRGIWPAELLLKKGIEVDTAYDLLKHHDAQVVSRKMKAQLSNVDGLCSVSEPLLNWSKQFISEKTPSWVVPCCTSVDEYGLSKNEASRREKRKELGIAEKSSVYGYLGGLSAYQNIPDLLIPIFEELKELDVCSYFIIITHEKKEFEKLFANSSIDKCRIKILSLNQQQVADYLPIVDVGFLLRKQNLVNQMAQPVKLAEYLSAGVPLCVNEKMSGIEEMLKAQIVVPVDVNSNKNKIAADCMQFLHLNPLEIRMRNAFDYALSNFSWSTGIHTHRTNYYNLLK